MTGPGVTVTWYHVPTSSPEGGGTGHPGSGYPGTSGGRRSATPTWCDECGHERTDITDHRGLLLCPDCIAVTETAGLVDPKLDARWEREQAQLERELGPFHREVRRKCLKRERAERFPSSTEDASTCHVHLTR
jgi:hypothetical protein